MVTPYRPTTIAAFHAALDCCADLGPMMPYCLARIRVLPNGCWEWTGNVNASGYGIVKRERTTRGERAHRVVYRLLVGPVSDALDLDHVCHDPVVCTLGVGCPHRRCVNPAHVTPATRRANTLRGGGPSAMNARKTHCPQGHPYDEVNTSVRKRGSRDCRQCHRDEMQRRRNGARAS